jgi:hypothetical protein
MKFKFEIEAGFIVRNTIRTELNNSKLKLEYAYPNCSVTIHEEKTVFESVFKIQGVNLPDTDEVERVIRKWFKQIENATN